MKTLKFILFLVFLFKYILKRVLLNFVVDCTYDEEATAKEVRCLAKSIETCWEEFAVELDEDLFTFSATKAIAREDDRLFMQARTMLDKWSNHHAGKAYRRLLIQALIKVDQRKVANDVFGEGHVERVSPQH